ncbi:MAG: glutathione S-transferase [Rhodospirillaceae bacterium]|nr:glutathione S-transferase [Rhodospirillaceae bacterium]|tara:strand:- start:9075 stop:9695 length:621 start_codon:yes stop_codon:yes gene_type:complete
MLKILGRKTSSNVQKVLWVCGEIGLNFHREDLGGPFGGNLEPEYLELNPNGVIPTIIDEDFILWESNSCTRYLARKHSYGNLYPENLNILASAERWMDWQLTVCSPSLVPVFRGLIRTPEKERNLREIQKSRNALSKSMFILDKNLERNEYVAGASFTIGDIPVGIAAYRWYEMPIEREEYPNLKRWFDTLSSRPAFQDNVMQGLA